MMDLTEKDMERFLKFVEPLPSPSLRVEIRNELVSSIKVGNRFLQIYERDVGRFWGKVHKSPYCWEWVGSRLPKGYGKFALRGQYVQAHRVSFTLAGGQLTPGLEMDHLCTNEPCVNPEHLEQVTSSENNRRKKNRKLSRV